MAASLTPDALVEAFRACGIGRGDVLMLHADAIVLAQLPAISSEDRFATLFRALDEVLGTEGTLILPTFSYSATKGETFDLLRSPSAVGMLTEYFRNLPGVLRSCDPIFSVAARGCRAAEFAAVPVEDCFGPESAFGLLDRLNGWLACLGCGFLVTFTHYVEQSVGVDYRNFKNFPARVIDADGREKSFVSRYLVRALDRRSDADLSGLRARLIERGRLAVRPVGRIALSAVTCKAFREEAQALIGERPNALIAEGNSHRRGGVPAL
jgi:aminoglycoside 3-N-acetyltransferase